MKEFQKNLCQLLKENNLSQSELARRIGVSSHTINKYCLGINEPKFETLRLICHILKCTYEEILGKL